MPTPGTCLNNRCLFGKACAYVSFVHISPIHPASRVTAVQGVVDPLARHKMHKDFFQFANPYSFTRKSRSARVIHKMPKKSPARGVRAFNFRQPVVNKLPLKSRSGHNPWYIQYKE